MRVLPGIPRDGRECHRSLQATTPVVGEKWARLKVRAMKLNSLETGGAHATNPASHPWQCAAACRNLERFILMMNERNLEASSMEPGLSVLAVCSHIRSFIDVLKAKPQHGQM